MSLPSSLTFSEELRNRPPHFNSTTVHDEAESPDTPDLLEDTPGPLSPTVPNLSDYVLPSFLLTSNSPTVPDGSASSLPPPELTFIRGRKGSDQACYNGYIYSKDRNRPNGDIYWQCRDRKIYTPSCTGRLYTSGKQSVRRSTEHNHPPSEKEVLKSAAVSTAKYDTSRSTPGDVLRSVLVTAPEDVKALMPSGYLLKKQIRNNRNKEQATPTTPTAASDIQFPEEYTKTSSGQLFLQLDTSTPLGKRVLIFSTDLVLDSANTANVDTLYGDGTFKVAPPQFEQLWVVRARFDEASLPVVYALLEDKKTSSYTAVLKFLRDRCPQLNPVTTILDFEKAEHNAACSCFPHTTIRCCLFHFCQSQLRRFRKIDGFKDDEILRCLLCSVYGLPFLPLADVMGGWTELKTRLWLLYPSAAISSYIAYFETNYMLSNSYPPAKWNVSSAVEYNEPRTNNVSEGGNNALGHAFKSAHPQIWTFVDGLKSFHAEIEQKYLHKDSGRQVNEPIKVKWREREATLKRIVDNYNPNAKLDFIRTIGYHF